LTAGKALSIVLCATVIISAGGCRHRHRHGSPNHNQPLAISNIDYGPTLAFGANLLDLYLPSGKGPYPLVICIHGGGWEVGDKAFFPCRRLIKNGYAVASINYRLSSQAPFPAQIVDCKLAIAWLRSHASEYNLDPERIGAWGISAGGHLAALVGLTGDLKTPEWATSSGTSSNCVAAVCDWCGPTDLISILPQSGMNSSVNEMVTRLLGTPPAVNPALAGEASPVAYAKRNAPPFLIMHGSRDTYVPPQQSQELNNLLKSAGADSTLIIVKGAKHSFFSRATEDVMLDFFDRKLKAKRPNQI